jgi:hypothetical protein
VNLLLFTFSASLANLVEDSGGQPDRVYGLGHPNLDELSVRIPLPRLRVHLNIYVPVPM